MVLYQVNHEGVTAVLTLSKKTNMHIPLHVELFLLITTFAPREKKKRETFIVVT